MTKANEHLDRAINAADHKVKELYDQKQKRRHARALIAELLRDAPKDETNPFQARSETQSYRFIAGFAEIKRRAGLEGEG